MAIPKLFLTWIRGENILLGVDAVMVRGCGAAHFLGVAGKSVNREAFP